MPHITVILTSVEHPVVARVTKAFELLKEVPSLERLDVYLVGSAAIALDKYTANYTKSTSKELEFYATIKDVDFIVGCSAELAKVLEQELLALGWQIADSSYKSGQMHVYIKGDANLLVCFDFNYFNLRQLAHQVTLLTHREDVPHLDMRSKENRLRVYDFVLNRVRPENLTPHG